MHNISLFCPNIIPQIHIDWLSDVFKPNLRKVLDTLETLEFNEHDLYKQDQKSIDAIGGKGAQWLLKIAKAI